MGCDRKKRSVAESKLRSVEQLYIVVYALMLLFNVLITNANIDVLVFRRIVSGFLQSK